MESSFSANETIKARSKRYAPDDGSSLSQHRNALAASARQAALPHDAALPHVGPDADTLIAQAVVFDSPRRMRLSDLALNEPQADEIIVDIEFSGISTGTERLFWTGDMPPFPGMAYPLVPGYESVGRVVWDGADAGLVGRRVFVPGSAGFTDARGLFGGAASRLVAKRSRVTEIDLPRPEEAVLLALAATAHHAIAGGAAPDLIIGHGALGRLLARVSMAMGGDPPVVWEIDPERADADGYAVIEPDYDGRTDYRAIYDVSGDVALLDELIARLAPGGEITLAGFYADRPSFAFPPAFMKEARLRVAAEWGPADMAAVMSLLAAGRLDLSGLITHRASAADAAQAYETAFGDPACLKMILDWKALS